MPVVTEPMRTAIRRKRGELNLNYLQMERETGVSHWTLSDILSGKRSKIQTGTLNRLNEWLYRHS